MAQTPRDKIYKKLSFFVIVLSAFLWLLQAFIKIFLDKEPQQVLWFSSIGLLLALVALFFRSSFMITSLFCAMWFIEGLWSYSFFTQLFFNEDILGITSYIFYSEQYYTIRVFASSYHLFILPILLIGFFSVRNVHSRGWLGALLFTGAVAYASYFFPATYNNINCLDYETNGICSFLFHELYDLGRFWRVTTGLGLVTLFLFIPTNIFLLFLAKRFAWKIK